MASEIAKEIIRMSQRQDRSSPLVIIVYDRNTISHVIRNPQENMRITTPIEGGKLMIRITFPTSNALLLGNRAGNQIIPKQTILDYDADNIEGAAACIEGYMSYRQMNALILLQVMENGVLGQIPLSIWMIGSRNETIESRVKPLQQILNALLVMSVKN